MKPAPPRRLMEVTELLAFAAALTKAQCKTLGLSVRSDGSTSEHGR